MSKIKLMIEIDEETYKQIKGDSVYDNNNKVIISNSSSAYYALNAIINATTLTECDDAVSRQAVKDGMIKYGFHAPDMTVTEFVEDLPPVIPKREENTVSEEVYTEEYIRRKALEYENYVLKQYIESKVEELENICANAPEEVLDLLADIKNAESVTPKCEHGEWIEHPHECGENWEFSKYECSICHMWEENDSDFCPNCGAEMR